MTKPKVFKNWLVRAGVIMLVVGTGPLLAIIAAAKLGLTADPDPNPVGPGMLAGLTFWPSVILIGLGVFRARKQESPL